MVKLVLSEPGSEALDVFLSSRRRRFSSDLLLAEVPRAVRRAPKARDDDRERKLALAMASLSLVSVRPPVLRLAATLEPASTGALDAIHIATALRVSRRVKLFVSYDKRQLAAARLVGLATASPGAEA